MTLRTVRSSHSHGFYGIALLENFAEILWNCMFREFTEKESIGYDFSINFMNFF